MRAPPSPVPSGLRRRAPRGLAAVALIFLLIAKDLSSAEVESGRAGKRLTAFSRTVVLPLVPLRPVFAVLVAVRVGEVL